MDSYDAYGRPGFRSDTYGSIGTIERQAFIGREALASGRCPSPHDARETNVTVTQGKGFGRGNYFHVVSKAVSLRHDV